MSKKVESKIDKWTLKNDKRVSRGVTMRLIREYAEAIIRLTKEIKR